MKKKFLSSLIVISMSMSMGVPVFAADLQGGSPQSGTVPVTGSIEKYTPPTPPTPSEINVSIPTSMAFDIGYNKDTQKANLKSADYIITNNGDTSVNVTSQYDVTDENGVTLTTPDKVNPTDSNLELALSLNAGQAANPTTPWIQNVTDKSTGDAISITSKATEHIQFSANDKDLANITQHAKDGKLTSETDVKGNLVLTFNAEKQAPTGKWSQASNFEFGNQQGNTISLKFKDNSAIFTAIPFGNSDISYSLNNDNDFHNVTLKQNVPFSINVKPGDLIIVATAGPGNVSLNGGNDHWSPNIKFDKNNNVTLKVTDTGLEVLMNN
ncbi:hypothetical protein [Clostridium sardiniense]|uniref:hypothetical protein n=1 Tax=Clostridium sardiniense TaxID=29369 RepID=UPI00195B0220|nr:hypothetical protein [Clostridium sardiniense]MBM7835486.1 hypothetical protein [Clostridium sardiniense]